MKRNVIFSEPEQCDGIYFECDNGECISASKVCDFVPDCEDGSDEICGIHSHSLADDQIKSLASSLLKAGFKSLQRLSY